MLANFFVEGGWGMYPVTIFGFALVVACALHAMRPQTKTAKLSITLGLVTAAAGLLGTTTGLCATFDYLQQVEPAKQFQIAALGVSESLNNLILALILVVLGGLISTAGTLRAPSAADRSS